MAGGMRIGGVGIADARSLRRHTVSAPPCTTGVPAQRVALQLSNLRFLPWFRLQVTNIITKYMYITLQCKPAILPLVSLVAQVQYM